MDRSAYLKLLLATYEREGLDAAIALIIERGGTTQW